MAGWDALSPQEQQLAYKLAMEQATLPMRMEQMQLNLQKSRQDLQPQPRQPQRFNLGGGTIAEFDPVTGQPRTHQFEMPQQPKTPIRPYEVSGQRGEEFGKWVTEFDPRTGTPTRSWVPDAPSDRTQTARTNTFFHVDPVSGQQGKAIFRVDPQTGQPVGQPLGWADQPMQQGVTEVVTGELNEIQDQMVRLFSGRIPFQNRKLMDQVLNAPPETRASLLQGILSPDDYFLFLRGQAAVEEARRRGEPLFGFVEKWAQENNLGPLTGRVDVFGEGGSEAPPPPPDSGGWKWSWDRSEEKEENKWGVPSQGPRTVTTIDQAHSMPVGSTFIYQGTTYTKTGPNAFDVVE